MKPLDLRAKLVVVTGASSGLGRDIARRLAVVEGADLVIAARRRERLEELKSEVGSASASRVSCVPVDLGTPEGVETLYAQAWAAGDVFALVNCAGMTYYGRTLDAPPGTAERIFSIDLLAGVRLSMLFLSRFLDRGSGAILTVTSLAALMPLPHQNVYAAAKHAMQSFMEGLAHEYRARGVTFSTFLPGGMDTELLSLAGLDKKIPADSPANMDSARAARIAIDNWKKGTERSVPGLLNKTIAVLSRLAPRALVAWGADRVYAP
jgi:short-subunit dehydrogenase